MRVERSAQPLTLFGKALGREQLTVFTAGLHNRTEAWLAHGALRAGLVLLLPACLVGLLLVFGFNIGLALAGLMALILLVLMFLYPAMTTLVVLFVLYANLPVVAIHSYGVPEMVAASFFLLLALPFLYYITVARRPLVVNRTVVLMAAYLSVLFLSAVTSGNVEASIDRVLSFVVEGLVLYVLVINTVRTPSLLRNAMWALILAGVLMGGISLYQELTGSYDNDFGGLAVVKDSGVMDTGQTDLLGKEVKRLRLSGPLGSKNRYAQVMVVLLPIAMMRMWGERRLLLRVLAAASCIPIVGGALLTFSRGAGISIILTLLAIAFLRILKLRHLLIVGVAGFLFVSLVIPDYIYRISTAIDVAELASGNTEDASGSVRGRATVNLAALHIFLDHPLLGVGPGQTSSYMIEYGNEIGFRRLETERRAHNMYLEELADTGLIGFAFFMGILGLTLVELLRVRRAWKESDPDAGYLLAGLMVAIIAYMSTAIFLHLSYVRYYWVVLALAGAATQIFGQGIVPALIPVSPKPAGLAPRLIPLAPDQESSEAR
ncbi:MAG: O-antigen ligase family protein [Caldilineaceae bacterium]|nr:O-antigen ligase family protein [Caldilineaceae bacterium]